MSGGAPPAGLRLWVEGARPRTLGAAVVPVLVGTAAASSATWLRTLGALALALALQVGVNYANDYYDGVKGVDTHARVGPVRLTASGLATPRAVRAAAFGSLALACILGVVLALTTGHPEILAIGAASVLAALLYSGGPAPYGARGLGEVFVFVFFGLVATCGTAYLQGSSIPEAAWWSAVPVGLLAVAILVANNLRDIASDTAAGKRTLAVRLGDGGTRVLYRVCIVAAFVIPVVAVLLGALPPPAIFATAAMPLAMPLLGLVGYARGPELVRLLVGTAATHASFGLMLAVGLWLG